MKLTHKLNKNLTCVRHLRLKESYLSTFILKGGHTACDYSKFSLHGLDFKIGRLPDISPL